MSKSGKIRPVNPAVNPGKSRGAALVIVLSILVLMVALVVMLLSRAGAERRAASFFGGGASARQLADLAVNVVQGQIHNATSGGITNAWASQPGMVRTYNSQGNLAAAYKLYSASNMVAGAVSLTEDLPPTGWKNSPGVWTDLNDPVRLPYSFSGSTSTNRPLVYPILDPRASNAIGTVNAVAGFSISNPPGGVVSSANAAPGNNPAPMPVRWLYVLQNGRLAVPSGQSGNVVSFGGADAPSATNPIVGRVAFWTDDETSKVNLNTAAEGTYWDTPRMTSTDDVRMAFYQPTRNEWQRYPGHPATTSLSAVFPWQNLPAIGSGTPLELVDVQARQAREAVRRATELSPAYRFGGSEAGTRAWLFPMGSATDDFFRASTNNRPRKRLYASVDELIFDDDANSSTTTRGSTNMLFQSSVAVARELLESRRFFLTAHSRAPETSLFNLPRVAIWPVFKLNGTNFNTNRTTAFDRQIARTATINGQPYFFQREDSSSTADLSGIARNVELLGYLDRLTSRNVPGFGGAFSGKYAQQDRRQLLVSIYDYIRSANLFDEYLFVGDGSRSAAQIEALRTNATKLAFTENFSASAQALNFARPGHGLVVPSLYNWGGEIYKGFGRFPSMSEFGLHFIATADGSGFVTNIAVPPAMSAAIANAARAANDAKLLSNSTNNLTLGGVRLKGEGFLDIGYGSAPTGATNGIFDWDDTSAIAGFPGWRSNGVCDFEPFNDVNENGLYDPGEPFWNANGNTNTTGAPQWDGEQSEPFHDWGRDNLLNKPSWDQSYWDGLAINTDWSASQWNGFVGTRNADTQANGRYDQAQVSIQAMPIVELFDPMQGFTQLSLAGVTRITFSSGLSVTGGRELYSPGYQVSVPFGPTTSIDYIPFDQMGGSGFLGFRYFAASARGDSSSANTPSVVSRTVRLDRTNLLTVPDSEIKIDFFNSQTNSIIQSINVNFGGTNWPIPRLVTWNLGDSTNIPGFRSSTNNAYTGDDRQLRAATNRVGAPTGMQYPSTGFVGPSMNMPAQRYWSFGHLYATNRMDTNTDYIPGPVTTNYTFVADRFTHVGGRLNLLTSLTQSRRSWKYPGIPGEQGSGAHIVEGADVVRTVYPQHGDHRLVNGLFEVSRDIFVQESSSATSDLLVHTLRDAGSTGHVPGFLAQSAYNDTTGLPATNRPSSFRFSDLPVSFNNGRGVPTGDWDSGYSVAPDGPFLNKPDEGNTYRGTHETIGGLYASGSYTNFIPYFLDYGMQYGGFATFSSPNRMIPSPGVFGSLPTALKSGTPWQTLLFRPQAGHPGQASPADHLMLDLFWMPVVEPYAISEPFSTAGKINMNYQIMPFTYIERSTGIQAVLVNERLGVVPDAHVRRHKVWTPADITRISSVDSPVRAVGSTRRPLNLPAIMRQFQSRFNSGDIFRSASEICSIHMVPAGENPTPGSEDSWAATFWANHRLTGENIRERIYTTVYPRLTTKSNTFTVHVRAQALKQPQGGNASTWDESRGSVAGEYRGSTTLERFVDPNNTSIPDYASSFEAGVPSLDSFYRWRVVQNRQFAP